MRDFLWCWHLGLISLARTGGEQYYENARSSEHQGYRLSNALVQLQRSLGSG
jgi:hypothetical protein